MKASDQVTSDLLFFVNRVLHDDCCDYLLLHPVWLRNRLNPEWKRTISTMPLASINESTATLDTPRAMLCICLTEPEPTLTTWGGGGTEPGFDPPTDTAKDDSGLWKWASNKPEMHLKVKNYVVEWREDE